MRLSLNRKRNVAYLRLRETKETVETRKLSDDLLLDVGPDGEVYGIELLNANQQLSHADLSELEVEDEETGESKKVSLPL